ncbi:MAG: HD domain-containing protein [Candidatus Cloacimonetes bacterium]|nr:HD domain-containing protein [Candidatus Cloacimonadota bacterium]
MEKIFITDVGEFLNGEIVSFFIVNQKEMREGTKSKYIRLRLSDRTGSLNGNIWNNATALNDAFKEGDVVKVKGIVISYKGQYQITVNNIRSASDNEYDLADFIATSSQDVGELTDRFFGFIENIEDAHIKELLNSIFGDKEFWGMFTRCPAAKSWHHNYMGGLIEHTVAVARICEFASHMYPVQTDILMAGALLHDVGKVYEYNMKTVIDFTTTGRLIGHICLGDEIICRHARQLNRFPDNTLLKLRHLILAHHGEYEKAAARLPQMLEAIVLHYADNLDAQTVGVKQLVEGALKSDSEWSEYDRLNNRYFYLG